MYSQNSKSMTDVELMRLARWRVAQRNVFKWHISVYFIVSALLAVIFFFASNGLFWPIWIIFGWGLLVALHGVYTNFALSDSRPLVTDEYNRLKGHAIVAEKMSGGISNENSD